MPSESIDFQLPAFVSFKIYLGKKRIQKHWNTFPSHRTDHESDQLVGNGSAHTSLTNSLLFNELVARLERTKKSCRPEFLLNELQQFVNEIDALKKFMFEEATEPNERKHLVDGNLCRLLSVEEKNFTINENFLENFKSSAENVKAAEIASIPQPTEVSNDRKPANAAEDTSSATIFENSNMIETPQTSAEVPLELFSYTNT